MGYEFLGELTKGLFSYTIYWLKTYDSGCPKGYEVYDKDGRMPSEGRLVEDILRGQKNRFSI